MSEKTKVQKVTRRRETAARAYMRRRLSDRGMNNPMFRSTGI